MNKDSKQTLYMVAYWINNNIDNMILEGFETSEEADKFEQTVLDKCHEADIECEAVIYIGTTTRYNDALNKFNDLIDDEKEVRMLKKRREEMLKEFLNAKT